MDDLLMMMSDKLWDANPTIETIDVGEVIESDFTPSEIHPLSIEVKRNSDLDLIGTITIDSESLRYVIDLNLRDCVGYTVSIAF